MNVQNPETKDENKVETEQGEKPDLALDKARELAEGKITFDDIKDENLSKEIHERFAIGEEEIPEIPKAETKEEPKPEVENKEVEKTPEIEDKPSQEYLQQRKKDLDELNTINQKLESSKKELERINKLKTEKSKTKYDDPLSEEAISNINDRLNQVEDRENQFYEDKSKEAQKEADNLKQERLLLELQVFQGDSGLKMSKPLKTIDAQYTKFLENVGGVEEASKFFKDEKFREQKEGEGVSFAISDSDFKKYQTIVDVNKFKSNGNYPTFNSAYADYSKENGIVHDQVKQAVIDATTETVEKMTSNQNTATTLSPDDGGSATVNSEMSKEQMAQILMNMPENPTPAQERQQKAIHKLLFPG